METNRKKMEGRHLLSTMKTIIKTDMNEAKRSKFIINHKTNNKKSFILNFVIMEKKKRIRQKKQLYFVVSSTTGVYRVFTDINACCDCYHELANSLSSGHQVRAGAFMWSDIDVERFNLFDDALLETSENA